MDGDRSRIARVRLIGAECDMAAAYGSTRGETGICRGLESVMQAFRRRTYRGLADLLESLQFLIGNRSLLRKAMQSGQISPGFRERLMMVVTEVNGCRYCSLYHSAQSLKAGLSSDELLILFSGQIPMDSPSEEIPALIYAQHWAETNAKPDFEATRHLVETYLDDKASMIHAILRMIRVGNLMCNTWDYFLYRISFGCLGLTAKDKPGSISVPAR
jgi:AhpD family alkylhydroperoxidase